MELATDNCAFVRACNRKEELSRLVARLLVSLPAEFVDAIEAAAHRFGEADRWRQPARV